MATNPNDTASSDAKTKKSEEEKALDKRRSQSWQERITGQKPLNHLEEAKADADFNYHLREQERELRAQFEAKKAGRLSPSQQREQGE
jgi:hypothetical protein